MRTIWVKMLETTGCYGEVRTVGGADFAKRSISSRLQRAGGSLGRSGEIHDWISYNTLRPTSGHK